MKMLKNTGVLGLLNVQESCDEITGGSSAESDTCTPSAAEEVLSKCEIPGKITAEETELTHVKTLPRNTRQTLNKKGLERQHLLKGDELSENDSDDKKQTKESVVSPMDSKGSVGTSQDVKGLDIEESLGIKEDKEVEKEKDMKDQIEESQEQTKSLENEISLEKDAIKIEDEDDDSCTCVKETEEDTEHAQKSTEDGTKNKTPVAGPNSFKAKRLRLDQITGKLSMQRQTQITAKREVIKQKIDKNLKSEEITKSTHVSPQTYQQISPNPPPYPCVSAPTPRIPPQYVERYPPPTLLTYAGPTQCTGPCCAYPPGNSYPPASSCGYHLSPGGLPRETYVVYGPGGQTSYPVITPTITSVPCKLNKKRAVDVYG